MAMKRARTRKPTGPRRVQCYLCTHWFEVGEKAMTVSCPKCYKPLMVQDLVIRQHEAVKRLETCGRISVEKKGRVIAERVTAIEGIEVRGVVHANVFSGQQVVMHPGAEWKGNCSAPAVEIMDGARVLGGFFRIPDRTYGERAPTAPVPEPVPVRASRSAAKKVAKAEKRAAEPAPPKPARKVTKKKA